MRFLVCEIWSIFYSTVVNSELGTCEKSGRDFAKYAVGVRGSSIQKHEGSRSAAPARGVRGPTSPPPIFLKMPFKS